LVIVWGGDVHGDRGLACGVGFSGPMSTVENFVLVVAEIEGEAWKTAAMVVACGKFVVGQVLCGNIFEFPDLARFNRCGYLFGFVVVEEPEAVAAFMAKEEIGCFFSI
jgi:hypothetical protein